MPSCLFQYVKYIVIVQIPENNNDMTSKNDKDYILKYRIYEDLLNKVGIIKYNKKNMFEKIN